MLEEIKRILREELFIEDEITLDTNLRTDLDVDSVAVVEIALQLETKYDIYISEKEIATLVTVSDVIKLLEEKINAK